MSHEDIEATKAPLMDHLIELRSRLIKALIAFGVMFANLLRVRQGHLQYFGVAVRVGRRARKIPSLSTLRCSNISLRN